MPSKTPRQIFFEECSRLFMVHEVQSEARGYLYSALRTPEKQSNTATQATTDILNALNMSAQPLSREQIVQLSGSTLSPAQISSRAAALVRAGQLQRKQSARVKGRSVVEYFLC